MVAEQQITEKAVDCYDYSAKKRAQHRLKVPV